jgi:alpha-L-rhamnosidase
MTRQKNRTPSIRSTACEYAVEPLGIEVRTPRLSWTVSSPGRNRVQSAYHLRCASDRRLLQSGTADLWDTGIVQSDQSVHVPYGGKPLSSRQGVWWSVRIWDDAGTPSPWSNPAYFELGLLNPEDWSASGWIRAPWAADPEPRPAPHFVTSWTVTRPVVRARAYVCGLGYHELYLNGQRIGDHVLDPGFTRYDRRVLYVTHDVTRHVRTGANTVGVILGNGFFNQAVRDAWDFHRAPWRSAPVLRMQLHLDFADGSSQTIGTGRSWKVAEGPIRFDNVRTGELYDARRAITGWCDPTGDRSSWADAVECDGPAGRLHAQTLPPMRIVKTIPAQRITQPIPGVYIVDFGVNITGWVRLRVCGPAGTVITLRHAERLTEGGLLHTENIDGLLFDPGFQTDQYICSGDGLEVWEPRFTYHGFRYVEVTGFPGTPDLGAFEARVVHTDLAEAGSFSCSHALLNRIQEATLRSYTGNFHSIPTDCPTREKNGWTGDAHLATETGLFNFHSASAYAKWMDDFKDEQRDSGELPCIVPTGGWGYDWGNGPCWDSAYPIIVWLLYVYRADTRIIEEHYERIKRYVDYLVSKSDNLDMYLGLGDWLPPYGRAMDYTAPVSLNATGYFYWDTTLLARMAAVLGKTDDAAHYGDLARRIREAFNRKYFDEPTGMYWSGTQTALATVLAQNLAPGERVPAVVNQLVHEVRRWGYRLNTGIHGTKFVMNALAEYGHPEIAYRLAVQTAFPSWGWWIAQGATTLWETWNGESSHNHIMFGDISAWMYKVLAGIRPDPDHPGFRRFTVQPYFAPDINRVDAHHDSPYGRIGVSWQRGHDEINLAVDVPFGTRAVVRLHGVFPASLRENNRTAWRADGVWITGAAADSVTLEVGSGTWRFTVRSTQREERNQRDRGAG